uniref:Uncharacterized protein n=1 Tax=Rhizophora mucronata TaxID=61149 RepID=A0A2P2NDI6_RHIMU
MNQNALSQRLQT